jgi:TolB-like protein/Flp pilus assembly protein TadD
LKPFEEDAKANLNHTFYRDQINKVARAIKDLIGGIQNPTIASSKTSYKITNNSIGKGTKRKIALIASAFVLFGILSFTYYYLGGFGERFAFVPEKSIAVLPFENMNKDPEQDYFSDGISEDILNHLTKIADLKVKSRTSTLQYKGSQKSIPEMGEELAVGNVVQGSVRRVGDKIRVTVELVDVKTDVRLWSDSYDREVKDVLSLQSEIAIEIANTLEAKLTDSERRNIQKESSQNIIAYDYFLRARENRYWFSGSRAEVETILQMVDRALKLDPAFSQAYALKARAWYNLRAFGVPQKTWQDSALFYSAKAIEIDPSSPDGYIVQANVFRYLGRVKDAEAADNKAYQLAPNNLDALRSYGMQLIYKRDERGADMILKAIVNQYSINDPEYYLAFSGPLFSIGDLSTHEKLINRAVELGDKTIRIPFMAGRAYWWTGHYEKALVEAKKAEKLSPLSAQAVDDLAWLYYLTGDLENAAKTWAKYKIIEEGFEDSTQTVAFRHRLGMVYSKMGRKKEADALFKEDLQIAKEQLAGKRSTGAWYANAAIFYGMAVDYAYFGNNDLAVQCLDSALQHQHVWDWGYNNDPMLDPLRDREDFKKIVKKVNDYKEFRKQAYLNAFNRLEASGELKYIMK